MANGNVLASLDWNKQLNSDEREVCHTQAALFELCQNKLQCDAFDFANKFMRSSIADDIDAEASKYYEANPFALMESLPSAISLKPIADKKSPEALHWIGYMYRYWALMGTPSKDVIEAAPIERAYAAYSSLHTLSVREAISIFAEHAQKN